MRLEQSYMEIILFFLNIMKLCTYLFLTSGYKKTSKEEITFSFHRIPILLLLIQYLLINTHFLDTDTSIIDYAMFWLKIVSSSLVRKQ